MKLMDRLNKVVRNILLVMFAIMATLVFGNVVLRYGFNSGIVFSEEASRFIFMWLTLISALLVMKEHGHLGMNSVINRLGETGQRISRFLADFMTFVCCLLLVHGTYKQVIFNLDNYAPVTGISIGLVNCSLLIASIGMVLVLAHSLWRQVTGRMPRKELVPHGNNNIE